MCEKTRALVKRKEFRQAVAENSATKRLRSYSANRFSGGGVRKPQAFVEREKIHNVVQENLGREAPWKEREAL